VAARDLRKARTLATQDEITELETGVLLGFVLA
jgi:hypothetical protein